MNLLNLLFRLWTRPRVPSAGDLPAGAAPLWVPDRTQAPDTGDAT